VVLEKEVRVIDNENRVKKRGFKGEIENRVWKAVGSERQIEGYRVNDKTGKEREI
jgi:hypothetical protein